MQGLGFRVVVLGFMAQVAFLNTRRYAGVRALSIEDSCVADNVTRTQSFQGFCNLAKATRTLQNDADA